MIKFEHNMLVLNNTFSEEDVDHINAFADYVRKQERERIIELLEEEFIYNEPVVIDQDRLVALITSK
jgi:hypothetical protein